jgi:nucleotide-binding universal stress UspA family protein
MYRSILVPLDGSRLAEHALPLALHLARASGANLQLALVHVPIVFIEDEAPLGNSLDRENRAKEAAYLQRVAGRLAQVAPLPVKTAVLDGPVVDALLEHAAFTGADLAVMTTHGRGPFSRFWLGSVTDELVRRLPVPAVVLRPHADRPADLAAAPALKHILVALDGSPLAEEMLEPAVALGTPGGAEYTLLRVVKPAPILGYDLAGYAVAATDVAVTEKLEAEARDYLDDRAGRLRARGLLVKTVVVVHEQPAVALLEQAAALGADVLALETHGRHGLARLLLGSTADKVLRAATVPVLVHRRPGKNTKGESP